MNGDSKYSQINCCFFVCVEAGVFPKIGFLIEEGRKESWALSSQPQTLAQQVRWGRYPGWPRGSTRQRAMDPDPQDSGSSHFQVHPHSPQEEGVGPVGSLAGLRHESLWEETRLDGNLFSRL